MQNVYLNYATPVFIILIILEILVSRHRKFKAYRLNDAITSLGCGIFTVSVELFLKAGLLILYGYLFIHASFYQFAENSWVTWVVFFFVLDFVYYWAHRWSHEVNFLWGVHVPHHQSEEYNLTTALRQGALQDTVHWPIFMTLAIMGCPPLVFITHLTFSKFYQFWIHTRLINKVPLIEGILNTPSVHRVHHGINDEYIDKNHGGVLMIWDRMFGTYEEEKAEAVFGVRKPYHSWNSVWAHFEWFAYLWNAVKSASWKDKLLVWFKPTGWVPNQQADSFESFDVTQVKKYDTKISTALNAYCIFQFALVMIANSALLQVPLALEAQIALTLYIAFALITVGLILLRGKDYPRSWAIYHQLANLALVPLIWNSSMIGAIILMGISFLSIPIYLFAHKRSMKNHSDVNPMIQETA